MNILKEINIIVTEKLNELVEEIDNCETETNDKNRVLRLIVGDDVYPSIKNTQTTNIGFYKDHHFNEAAFITKEYTLDLLSILSILFGSTDLALGIMQLLKNESVSDEKFVRYLLSKNIVMVNQKHNIDEIKAVLKEYNHKVLFVGKKATKKLKKYTKSYLTILHCSPKNYSRYGEKCIKTYFSRNIERDDNEGTVTLDDFLIEIATH